LLTLGCFSMLRAERRPLRVAGGLVAAAVALQIAIGLCMVHFGMPLALATLHNAGAALLVIAMVTLLRMLWPARANGVIPYGPV
jgi:cytochrome c oxidase assembly protein subunit 15